MPTLASQSPGLSPAVLEELTQTLGVMTGPYNALSHLGKHAMKTVHALDALHEMFEGVSSLGHAVKELDPMSHFSPSIVLGIPPLAVQHSWDPYQNTNTEPVAITRRNMPSAIQLPLGAQWSKIQCHFTDEYTLSVSYQGKRIGRYDYEKLGFGRKNMGVQKPDVQWELLYKLAMLYSYEGNKLVEPTVATLAEMLAVSEATLFKRMSRLSQRLQQAFGIDDAPFLDYLPTTGYRTQFSLRSEPLLRGQGNILPSGSQVFEEHTPDSLDEQDWN